MTTLGQGIRILVEARRRAPSVAIAALTHFDFGRKHHRDLRLRPRRVPENGFAIRLPVQGRISSRFGPRLHPILGVERMHAGIDIAATSGTPIHVVAGGTVSFAGTQRGYGLTVVVDHGGGRQTLYAHCSGINVKVGQAVASGDVVGTVGQTGLATGSHVHFEVRQDGRAIDPGVE